jgi:hypothetical protein
MTIIRIQTTIGSRVPTSVAGVQGGGNPVGRDPIQLENVVELQNAYHCAGAIGITVKDQYLPVGPVPKGLFPMEAVVTLIQPADRLQEYELYEGESQY